MTEPDHRHDPARILLVDDEEHVRRVLELMLGRQGYAITTAGGGTEALEKFAAEVFDLVILDLRMPDLDGISVLERMRAAEPDQTVVMITAYASVDTALAAMKQGAFDYIGKPFKEEEILLVVEKALKHGHVLADNRRLRCEVQARHDFGSIIGRSPAMERIFNVLRKVADTKATVLITGESGTGKELVARAIHYNSRRRDRPFVAVNCAAIPATLIESELFGAAKGAYTGADRARPGLFEEAGGSSLFLDEIGELPLEVQAKLLRALQEGEIKRVGETTPRRVDIRIIAATNKDLAAEAAQGRFREDLFYRLNVIGIHLPPLRQRPEDIPLLAAHFLLKAATTHEIKPKKLSPAALAALAQAPLKGNVREMENILEQAMLMSDGPVIEPQDLFALSGDGPEGGVRVVVPPHEDDLKKVLKLVTQKTEEQVIRRVLQDQGGNRTRAAQRLGISRRALITKIQEIGLD
ncbi:MAG: sigma-54-dependent Fis family transcriptional regulator [Desulfarculus sp.]|nr:sigma-54-dependent Fis family transcriptional regulator [Desulfarculus sp.]